MSHGLTHFSLYNSLPILKALAASHLHRTTLLRPGFPTSLVIPLLVLIQRARKLVDILIPKLLSSSFLSGSSDKKGEKTKMYLYFYHLCNSCSCIVYEYTYSFLSQLLSCVCKLCVFEIQSGFVIFPKRERLLSCIPCFSLFLFSCFGMILKLYLNLFFPRLFLARNRIPGLPFAVLKNHNSNVLVP